MRKATGGEQPVHPHRDGADLHLRQVLGESGAERATHVVCAPLRMGDGALERCVDGRRGLEQPLVLAPLAETGAATFLFFAAPLPLVGATGSPLTPVAVL